VKQFDFDIKQLIEVIIIFSTYFLSFPTSSTRNALLRHCDKHTIFLQQRVLCGESKYFRCSFESLRWWDSFRIIIWNFTGPGRRLSIYSLSSLLLRSNVPFAVKRQ